MPPVRAIAIVTNMRFVGSNSQVCSGYLQNRLSADFANRVLLWKGVMVFKETTNYDFILPSKACQRS